MSDEADGTSDVHMPRPVLHFTPERNWMNDPNGLVWVSGKYHLFYQHNPQGIDWGNMSWGHAVSTDLTSWTELDVAIPCTETESVFSGSAVVDHQDSSGLGDGSVPVVACYTAVDQSGIQAQALAVSRDEGATWERFEGNPVLDRGSHDFRDPKVVDTSAVPGGAPWTMVAVEANDHELHVYTSHDLRKWTWASVFDAPTPHPGVWECPDLVPLAFDGGTCWVLVLSVNTEDPGHPQGSAMYWLPGEFDGERFVPRDGSTWTLLDRGRDFYAGVTFANAPDGRRIMVGWMSNWQYAREVPTAPFRGAQSVARELSLREVGDAPVLLQRPVIAPGALGPVETWRPSGRDEVESSWDLSTAAVVTMRLPGEAEGTARLSLVLGADAVAQITVDLAEHVVTFVRPQPRSVSMPATYESTRTMPIAPGPDGRALDLVIDAHLVELFAGDGESVMSHQVFGSPGPWRLRLALDIPTPVEVDIRRAMAAD